MLNILLKTLFICFITFIIFNYVKSIENDSYVDIFENDSEINKSLSSSDYFDYNELNISEESVDDCHKQSLIEKIKLIHEEGKNVTFTKYVKHINETFNVINNLQKVFAKLFPTDASTGLEIIEFLTDIDLGLSHECSVALFTIITEIRKYELWAIKFFDSIGNVLPSGFAEGIQSSFGEYDQCLNIKSPAIDGKYIKGQYCLLKLILPFPPLLSKDTYKVHQNDGIGVKFADEYGLQHFSTIKNMIEMLNIGNGVVYRLGICIPSVCSSLEVENMLNKILYPITRFPVEIGPKCHTKDETIKLDNFQLFSITILTILTFIVILSTGFEIHQNINQIKIHENSSSKPTKIRDIFLSFSIIRNTQSLFVINKRFAALDTLRLLLILNVHIAHQYEYSTAMGLISLKKIYSQVIYQIFEDSKYFFARSRLMLDALFTLSGFLLSFGLLNKLKKRNGSFNYLEFIFQRWFVFMVLLFGSILFYYLYPLSGSGPIWDLSVKYVTTGCKTPNALLDNFLFINNFRGELVTDQNSINKCNIVSWYLSTLLQLTMIAPIFIMIHFKNKIIGIYTLISAIIISLFASISPYLLFGIKPYLQLWDLETTIYQLSPSYKWFFYPPHIYATSFFVGMAFGYLLIEKASFSRLIEILFWILSIISIIGVYLWNNNFWRLDKSAPLLSSLLYFSIGKLLFSLGIAWIYFACASGRGGYFNRFLSWHGFQPIARLSFGIYLLHYLVIIHRISSVRNIYVMSDKLMHENILVDIIYATILAYIFYILIESPFNNIFGLLMNRKSQVKLEYLNNNNHITKF